MATERKVDVEEPHEPAITILLSDAIKKYALNEGEVDHLLDGAVVWYGNIALTLHEGDDGD